MTTENLERAFASARVGPRERHSRSAREPDAVPVVAGPRSDQPLRRRQRLVRGHGQHRRRAAAARRPTSPPATWSATYDEGIAQAVDAFGRAGRARQDDRRCRSARFPAASTSASRRPTCSRTGGISPARPVSRPISIPSSPRSCSKARGSSSSPRSAVPTASVPFGAEQPPRRTRRTPTRSPRSSAGSA